MAITDISATAAGSYAWVVSWTSTGSGPFYVYVDGDLALVTSATSARVVCEAGDPLMVEVLETEDTPEHYPARAQLFWWGVSGADKYRIEEMVSGAWTRRAEVSDDGSGAFTWESRILEDDTTHEFRVVPVGAADGTARRMSFLCVRYPDPPVGSYSYDGGTRKLTVNTS